MDQITDSAIFQAILLLKEHKENKDEGLAKYLEALQLGYTKPIPEIYKTAGIEFNFSEVYINELLQFVLNEHKSLVEAYSSL